MFIYGVRYRIVRYIGVSLQLLNSFINDIGWELERKITPFKSVRLIARVRPWMALNKNLLKGHSEITG